MQTKKDSVLAQLANAGRMSRRHFLKRSAAAGMALGLPALPSLLAGCGGSAASAAPTMERTLFFNLSHVAADARDHVLHVAGKRYALTRSADAQEVLERERRSNRFLGAVPDNSITHHIDAVALPANAVILAYLTCMEDPAQGTWAMTMTHLILPQAAHEHAWSRVRAGAAGAMPHSAKRQRYQLPPAASARDMMEESMLVDVTDHAHALIGLHSDLVSLDPGAAAYMHGSYIGANPATAILADALSGLGPAMVQQTAGQPNRTGWATLAPLMNRNLQPPAPYKKSDGRLNLYLPEWNEEVKTGAAKAVSAIQPQVADDESLGLDVTGVSTGRPLQPDQSRGRLWRRHDGQAGQDRSAVRESGAPAVVCNSLTTETGLALGQPAASIENGFAAVTLGNVNNWFLRWLGVWLQFRKNETDIIPAASLPPGTLKGWTGPGPMDRTDAIFAGMMPPVNVLAGIPVDPGVFAPEIRMPPGAVSMQVMYGGLGAAGMPGGLFTEDSQAALAKPGVVATVLVNYVLTTLFMAAGASPAPEALKVITDLLAQGLALYLTDYFSAVAINQESIGEVIETMTADLAVMIVNHGANELLVRLFESILPALAEAEIIDSVPVAGQIARIVAAAVGAIQIGETTAEVLISPPVYAFGLAYTRKIVVAVRPDSAAGAPGVFPLPSSVDEILYYKLSYVFDSGTCHELPAVDFPALAGNPQVLTVELDGMPLGGNIKVTAGLYIRKAGGAPGASQRCVAKGETDLVPNNADFAPTITLTNVSAPIQAGSAYIHTSRTVLDESGAHAWRQDGNAPPYLPPPGDQQPGLGAFRNITVRQRTAGRDGYIGYAWQAYSGGAPGCGGSPGQADYLASMGVDANPQKAYAGSPCGLQSGARISYSLLSDDGLNLYLDPAQLYLRQVRLGTAAPFSGSGLAYGRLNLNSSCMLLHPSGHAVSINAENHVLETLRLPGAPVDEATAGRLHLARPHSGQGSRPGLMNKPMAAVVAPDGVILVLEASDTNNRIQAFDLGGNPVPYFKHQAPPYFLQLKSTPKATYLDLAVEFGGYMYVLSRDDAGVHRLDIYSPAQTGTAPISTTFNVNAAAIAVDFWRDLFTLNYQPLALPGGAAPGLPEPSVSLWKPSAA